MVLPTVFVNYIPSKKKETDPFGSASFRGATENRTRDTRIFSPLLYQLSYGTIPFVWDYKDRQYFLQCKLFRHYFYKICQFLYFFGIFSFIPGRISVPIPLNFMISSALTPG